MALPSSTGSSKRFSKARPTPLRPLALGRAYFELGELTAKIGDRAAALAVHRKALETRRLLTSETSGANPIRGDLAESLNALAYLLSQTGHLAEALDRFQEAHDLLDEREPSRLDSDGHRALLGTIDRRMGTVLKDLGKTEEAMSAYQRSVDTMSRLAEANPNIADYRMILADGYYDIGVLRAQTARPNEAFASYDKALGIRQKLADESPAVIEYLSRLATSHNSLGALHWQIGQQAAALASYKQALAIRQKLARDNPAVTDFQNHLAASLNNIGRSSHWRINPPRRWRPINAHSPSTRS